MIIQCIMTLGNIMLVLAEEGKDLDEVKLEIKLINEQGFPVQTLGTINKDDGYVQSDDVEDLDISEDVLRLFAKFGLDFMNVSNAAIEGKINVDTT